MKHDERLEFILDKAAEVFAAKGFHRASIRDISRATGMSVAGLYYYFRSKEELLFLISDHAFAVILENLEQALSGVTDPTEKFFRFVANHFDYFLKNVEEMKVISHDYDCLKGRYRTAVAARRKQYFAHCVTILQELLAARKNGGGGAQADRIAVMALFGMINWIYTWYRPEVDGDAQRLAQEMARIFLVGYLGEGNEVLRRAAGNGRRGEKALAAARAPRD